MGTAIVSQVGLFVFVLFCFFALQPYCLATEFLVPITDIYWGLQVAYFAIVYSSEDYNLEELQHSCALPRIPFAGNKWLYKFD